MRCAAEHPGRVFVLRKTEVQAMNSVIVGNVARPADPSLITYTHVIYALHALSALIGLTSGVTVIGSFIFGLPSIVAVIMNYARRSETRGTFLESHFRWQIRTFWFALLMSLIVWIVSLPLMLAIVGFATLWLGLALISIWLIYRIARGWIALRDGRAMYV
jgi:uncharacterized membrane protein